ncbi:hypothetical protein C8J57DRAFT_123722 [Mycena rebaudengoi]|nr:hypothetical protein C8J57DRAFT_123722 [Mycena rebaudengoi]
MVPRCMPAVLEARASRRRFPVCAFIPDIAKSVAAGRLTDIGLHACNHCRRDCIKLLPRGWLRHISFASPKRFGHQPVWDGWPCDPTFELPRVSSSCSSLDISCMNITVSPDGLSTLLKSMVSLKELGLDVFDRCMPHGAPKKCLANVASTLTLLALTDYHSSEMHPQPWENNTVSVLQQLKTLLFNGAPVTGPLFDMLPPWLEHLRFAGTTVNLLPAPTITARLRRERFPLRGILKKLEFVRDMRANDTKRGPTASDAQVAES